MQGHPLAKLFTSVATNHIHKTFGVSDPKEVKTVPSTDITANMTPTYPVGCKRIIVSSIYYDSLVKPNVQMHYGSINGVDNGNTIVSEETGRPRFEIRGTVAARAEALGVVHVHVSLSHDAGIASAVVVLES